MADQINDRMDNHSDELRIEEEVRRLEENERKTACIRDVTFIGLLIILSTALLIPSVKMWMKKPGGNSPGMFPTLTTFVMLLSSLIALIQALLKRKKEKPEKGTGGWESFKVIIGTEIPFTVFVMIVATVLYVVGMGVISFYVSTFIYLLFAILFLYGGRKDKILQAVLVAGGADLAVWLIIDKLFQIHMP